jgi:hypothetical protein
VQENLRLIRIFIGSPGGLEDERQAAHDVVKEINQYNSDHWGSIFKLMGWEEAIPGYRRAQDKINEDLDRCDYFVGVIWDKWGSKPSTDPHGYTSGFEEEYHRSTQRIDAGAMKDMAMFFKKVEVPSGMEPGTEIKKVLDFRQKCIEEKKVFFRDFGDIDSFKNATRAKLMEIGWLEYDSREASALKSEQEDQPPLAETETEFSGSSSSRLIDIEAQNFLSEMFRKSADWDTTEPCEIARFRLISSSISRSGNDDAQLGTHDANLIFRHYRDADLSDQELTALLDCGVAGFRHQNVPLWHWIAKVDMGKDDLFRLRILATVGENAEKIGAIKILQNFNSPLPTHDGDFNKTGVLTDWLSNDTDTDVLDAVVSFLGTNATEEDVPLIERAALELPPYKKSKVKTAIVEIFARRSVEGALAYICTEDVSNIGSALALKLLAKPQSLTTDTLKSCLAAKPDEIRVGAAKILYERGEINEDDAKNLLTDDNAEVRLVASEVLHSIGKALEESVLEKALKVPKASNFSLFGYSSNGPDTTQLELYRANRRAELDVSQLVKAADGDVFQYKCLATLFEQHTAKVSVRLRKELNSNFSEYFDRSTAGFREKHDSNEKSLDLLEKIIPSYKKELCNSAAQALCKLRKPEDLTLVRQCVDTLELEAQKHILEFLARFGDWQDVDRILRLGRDGEESRNALAFAIISLPEERAAALLSVGKSRIADLLSLDLDTGIRTAILKQVSKSTFVSLADDLILRELAHTNSESRAIVALRSVQDFSKARVTALLDSYVNNAEYRFYNSIHWLDLGASLPSKVSKSIARRVLALR